MMVPMRSAKGLLAGWGQKKKKKRELARLPAGGWVADQCTMVSPDEHSAKKKDKKDNERAPVFTDEKMVGGGAAARDGAPRVLPVSDQNARMRWRWDRSNGEGRQKRQRSRKGRHLQDGVGTTMG